MRTIRHSKTAFAVLFAAFLPLGAACNQRTSGSASSKKQVENRADASKAEASGCLVSKLAGKWYPASSEKLKQQIEGLLDKAEAESLSPIEGLILPHAGYRWCGNTLAQGVKQLASHSYERVILLGPSHRMRLKNQVSVPDVGAYETPLGRTPLDTEVTKQLKESPYVKSHSQAHRREHSVQIELPFLQVALDSFKLIPVVTGKLDEATSRKIADLLRPHINTKTLVVVSSDFIHYGRAYQYVPFSENIKENLKELTLEAYHKIAKLDASAFTRYMRDTGATICGSAPIAVLLNLFSPEATEAVKLDYSTSAERSGDYRRCVTYISAAFISKVDEPEDSAEVDNAPEAAFELSEVEQETLLTLARKTLRYRLKEKKMPGLDTLDMDITEKLKKKRAAFVTLKKEGRLRGCIGDLQAKNPLYRSVMKRTVSAALNDPRFRPVKPAELSQLRIEISVLTSPRAINSWKKIKIGTHGVILKKRGRSAVYLPHVAQEQNWNRQETLRHLSKKAGLAPDAWKEKTSFHVFQAIRFSEGE